MSRAEDCETVRMLGNLRATRPCIGQEAVPPPQAEPTLPTVRGRKIGAAVDGDRVVDRGHQWQPACTHPQQAIAQRLVVVDDIEVSGSIPEQPRHSKAEGQRLGEPCGVHRCHLEHVDGVAELASGGRAERVRLAIQVKAWDLGQQHARIEDGIRLSGEDLDGVAERDELAAEVADIDTLTTAVRLAAIRQQRDAARCYLQSG